MCGERTTDGINRRGKLEILFRCQEDKSKVELCKHRQSSNRYWHKRELRVVRRPTEFVFFRISINYPQKGGSEDLRSLARSQFATFDGLITPSSEQSALFPCNLPINCDVIYLWAHLMRDRITNLTFLPVQLFSSLSRARLSQFQIFILCRVPFVSETTRGWSVRRGK